MRHEPVFCTHSSSGGGLHLESNDSTELAALSLTSDGICEQLEAVICQQAAWAAGNVAVTRCGSAGQSAPAKQEITSFF